MGVNKLIIALNLKFSPPKHEWKEMSAISFFRRFNSEMPDLDFFIYSEMNDPR